MTPARRHLSLLHCLPCVVCKFCYGTHEIADEAHHLEYVRGKHSDYATVPLCKVCHVGMHEHRRKAFYRAHKLDDIKLLAWTIKLIQSYYESGSSVATSSSPDLAQGPTTEGAGPLDYT